MAYASHGCHYGCRKFCYGSFVLYISDQPKSKPSVSYVLWIKALLKRTLIYVVNGYPDESLLSYSYNAVSSGYVMR